MKKLFEELESREWTGLEIFLSILTALLGGIVLGALFSSKGDRYYGSFNGNNELEDWEDWEDFEDEED